MLAVFAIGRKHFHYKPVAQRAAYVAHNSTLFRYRHAPHERKILAARGLIEKLLAEIGLGIGSFGHHEQAGCVLVNAVHEAEPRVGDIIIGIIFEMPCEGIDERAGIVSVSGMHHQSGGLVDHKHVVVLVDYVERYVFGQYLEIVARTVHHYLHHIERLDPVIGFYCFAVDEYAPGIGGILDAVSVRITEMIVLMFTRVFCFTIKERYFFETQSCSA